MGYCALAQGFYGILYAPSSQGQKINKKLFRNKKCPGNKINSNSNNNKRTVEQPRKINHTCNYDELVRTRTFMGVRPWEKLMGKHIRENT